MAIEHRNLHLRLQEFCDCYMETDFKQEMDTVSREQERARSAEEWEEAALKFLALAIMYGTTEGARKLTLSRSGNGEIGLHIDATGSYKLPAPPPRIADDMFRIMRSITHLEAPKASEPVSLGLKNDRLDIQVVFDREGDRESLTIAFP